MKPAFLTIWWLWLVLAIIVTITNLLANCWDSFISIDLQGQPQTITLPPLATIQYHICPQ